MGKKKDAQIDFRTIKKKFRDDLSYADFMKYYEAGINQDSDNYIKLSDVSEAKKTIDNIDSESWKKSFILVDDIIKSIEDSDKTPDVAVIQVIGKMLEQNFINFSGRPGQNCEGYFILKVYLDAIFCVTGKQNTIAKIVYPAIMYDRVKELSQNASDPQIKMFYDKNAIRAIVERSAMLYKRFNINISEWLENEKRDYVVQFLNEVQKHHSQNANGIVFKPNIEISGKIKNKDNVAEKTQNTDDSLIVKVIAGIVGGLMLLGLGVYIGNSMSSAETASVKTSAEKAKSENVFLKKKNAQLNKEKNELENEIESLIEENEGLERKLKKYSAKDEDETENEEESTYESESSTEIISENITENVTENVTEEMTTRKSVNNVPRVRTAQKGYTFYKNMDDSGSINGLIEAGSEYTQLEDYGNGWFRIEYNGQKGYININK